MSPGSLRSNRSLSLVVCALFYFASDVIDGSGPGVPCTYEGHLKTDRNWFGYLANVSIVTTGRMTFRFNYPAERCCQNVLFYTEDLVTIINARMNCWQKEYLLRPEDDQILRLTPRFSWSGCHVTHPNGAATYVCEGGRSFTVDHQEEPVATGPTSWYVAVSNCATLQGLDLQYRLVVYGHVGECRSAVETSSSPLGSPPMSGSASGGGGDSPRFLLMQKSPSPVAYSSSSDSSCVLDGVLNTSSNWYGFLANISLSRGGGLQFRFTYPAERQVQNVLLYDETDVGKLTPGKTCWQKQGVIHPPNSQEKVLDLSFQSSWNGCVSKAGGGGGAPSESSPPLQVTCQGERWYDEPRTIFMAVSNCLSRDGLVLRYRLEVFGFTNDICSVGAESTRRRSRWLDRLFLLFLSAVLLRTQVPCLTLQIRGNCAGLILFSC